MERPLNSDHIRQAIYQAKATEQIVGVLRENHLAGIDGFASYDRETSSLIHDAILTLRSLTQADARQAETLILTYVLPWLERAGSLPENTNIEIHLSRSLLREWIYQYPEDNVLELLASISSHLSAQLALPHKASDGARVVEVGFTAASIGYRFENLAQQLWKYSQVLRGEPRDQVLAGLTGLHPLEPLRYQILQEIHRRIRRNGLNQYLVAALEEYADPSSIPVILHTWLKAPQPIQPWDNLLILSALDHLLDGADDEMPARVNGNETAAMIWKDIILHMTAPQGDWGSVIAFNGSLLRTCNTPNIIPDALDYVSETEDSEQGQTTRWRMYMRLKECVRVGQMSGWERVERGRERIERDAAIDTKYDGRGQTSLSLLKDEAWQCLLRAGFTPDRSFFREAVEQETNFFVKGAICSLLASVHLSYFPPALDHWIREEHDIRDDHTGESIMREKAIILAQGIASFEAFDALRACGLHYDGYVLLNTAQSLAQVSESLVRAGNQHVIDILLKQLENSPTERFHTLAAVALEQLARFQLLAGSAVETIAIVARVLADEQRTEHQRTHLVMILGHLASVPIPLLALTTLWNLASTDPGILGLAALEALVARKEALTKPDVLEHRLGLQNNNDGWQAVISESPPHPIIWSREGEWRIRIIANLYRQYPESFQQVVVDLLTRDHPASPHLLLWAIEGVYRDLKAEDMPTLLQESILTCVQSVSVYTRNFLAAIHCAGRLIPDAFCLLPWADLVKNYDTRMVGIIASILGSVHAQSAEAQEAREHFLITLMNDVAFGIRRSAYRGFGQQTPNRLEALCIEWSESNSRQLRLHAAEIVSWYRNDDPSQQRALARYLLLKNDADRTVRERAQYCWNERRERMWADNYLFSITAIEQWSDEQVRHFWPHGAALAQIGDDDHLQGLWNYLNTSLLPPHVRIWLEQVAENMEKQWKERSAKWPKDMPTYMLSEEI